MIVINNLVLLNENSDIIEILDMSVIYDEDKDKDNDIDNDNKEFSDLRASRKSLIKTLGSSIRYFEDNTVSIYVDIEKYDFDIGNDFFNDELKKFITYYNRNKNLETILIK